MKAKASIIVPEKAIVGHFSYPKSERIYMIVEEGTIKQRDPEEDLLAKAESAVEAAMQALDTLDQKDLSSCKGMLKPLPSLMKYFESTMCLLAGILPSIVITIRHRVKSAYCLKCAGELYVILLKVYD
jgi:hypothetical protein